jgi:glycosyltransferase involved in cell wall biosynthesis
VKIAIIAPTEIPARRANTLQVMKMAQAMVVLGHQVRLAAPVAATRIGPGAGSDEENHGETGRPGQAPTWNELARHYGLQHEFPLDWLPADPRLRRYDYSYRALRWARQWRADLIYTRLPQAAALASFMVMPSILEVHDLPQGSLGPWMLRRFLSGSGRRRLVVITRSLAADITQRMGISLQPPFTVIASDGVDLERYASLPSPPEARRALAPAFSEMAPMSGFQLQVERFTAGYTGHLYAGRGTELLLRLAERLPEINFLIVGGDPEDVAHFQAQARERQLKNTLLTGFVPNAGLPLYQAACDVLLMPYQKQVAASSGGDIARYLSPMKLFEYLACERPIVSSDLPVLGEVLNSENAILLPMEDIQAWCKALLDLQNDRQLRERLAAQAHRDAQQYTWEARAAKILEGLA